ncbi:hypothetical protein E0E54_13035 [Azotobacter chroococcum]|nr:hypothetical protein E0E54_13035 [Azotobacter chroococcum]
MSYHELSVAEHVAIQIGLLNRFSQHRIARLLNRSPCTISCEIRRNRTAHGYYVTHEAQRFMSVRRQACRPHRKLVPGNELFVGVHHKGDRQFGGQRLDEPAAAEQFGPFADEVEQRAEGQQVEGRADQAEHHHEVAHLAEVPGVRGAFPFAVDVVADPGGAWHARRLFRDCRQIFSGDFRASTGAIRTAAGLIVPISAFILMNRFTYRQLRRKTLKRQVSCQTRIPLLR